MEEVGSAWGALVGSNTSTHKYRRRHEIERFWSSVTLKIENVNVNIRVLTELWINSKTEYKNYKL